MGHRVFRYSTASPRGWSALPLHPLPQTWLPQPNSVFLHFKFPLMKQIIHTANAPQPIGPYNQATQFGNLLFVSGQIASDPATGQVIDGDISAHTKRVMQNLEGILTEAGYTFEHVLKATIFLTDMNDFAAVNAVYGSYFNEKTAPARETVQVAGLPKGVPVEISVIAAK